ncbi:unnamed protein product [Closterium sp. NIES-54]
MYTLSTESPPVSASGQVAASSQVLAAASGSGPESAPCSCRLLSHQTLLWHHRLGHPSLPRLRGMASRVLVSGLPRSLHPLPPGPAPTCVPCVERRQRAAPHSSEFPPTEAPLQTLYMDVWGPARVRGQGHERYFLLVVDDYSRYTTVFPLRSKGEVTEVLIDWIRAARLWLRESFGSDFPVLRLHSDRGGEFSSARLGAFCRAQGIRQTFTLPASPQQNGIAERRIGMVMDVARTSMIHAAAPHFLWPFAVQYAAHQLNLQPRVSLPETSPTLLWTGKVSDACAFRVWGSRAFVRDLSADKLSPRAVPCVFLGFPPDAPGWQFYHPTSRRVLSSQDVTFDESVPYYRLFLYRTASLPPPPLFLAPGPPPVDPLPPQGPAPSGVSQVDAVEPVEVAVDSGAATGAEPAGTGSGGAGSGGAETGGAEPGGAESGGADPRVTEPGGAEPGGAGSARVASRGASSRREVLSQQELREWFARRWSRAAGAGGTTATTGSGGSCPGGAGAAGPGGTAEAAGVGPPGGSAGASCGTGAAGSAGPTAAGATGVGATGGVDAGGYADTGPSEGAGAGAAGAGGTTGAGAPAGSPGSGGAPRPRPYFVTLLEQVLGLPPSPSPAPPSECPQPVQSQSLLQPVSPLPAPSPYTGPTGGLAERRAPASRPASPARPACTSRRTSRPRPPAVPGTHQMALRRPHTDPGVLLRLLITLLITAVLLCSWVNMEAEGSAPAGPSGSGGVRGAGEAGRGVVGGSAPIASVSTPAKDDVKAFNLEKFSGEDWASWNFRMELLFNHYGLLEVMDGELKRPASEGATKEWDRRSKDGFFLLSQCLSSNQLHHVKHLIKDIQCGSKAWKILKDVHAPSSEAIVVVLERQLHAVKINEGDAVQGAFDQLRDLYVKLSAAGVDYPEKIKCYKALSLLPESWGPLVVNLNGMKDSWSLEWFRAQVIQEEFRRKELTTAAGEGGGSAYGMKGLKGRGSKKCKAKEGSGGEQYSGGKRSNKGGKRCGGKCWYCHVEGHPWFKCRKLPDGWRPGQPSIEGSKGVHGAMGEGMGSEEGDGCAGGHGGMFYHVGEACSEDMVVPASKVALHRSSHWVIDTGAFMTMTNREDLLDEVRPSKAATVVSATGQVVPVRGEGRAMFMGADGRLVGLKRVLLVPGLCANLLSTKALSEAGMKMEMMGTKVFKATLDGRVLWDLRGGKDMHRSMWEIPVLPWKEAAARLAAEAVREGHASHVTSGGGGDGSDGGLLVHGGGALPSVTPSTGETDWLTAHRRFGHVALPQLQQLFKEERVRGLRIKGEPKEVGSCETCLTSKFSRFPFHSTVGQSSDPVELVHVDLVGPMKVKGDGGALYSMTMVDDYTRLTWSFSLAKKSGVVEGSGSTRGVLGVRARGGPVN